MYPKYPKILSLELYSFTFTLLSNFYVLLLGSTNTVSLLFNPNVLNHLANHPHHLASISGITISKNQKKFGVKLPEIPLHCLHCGTRAC